MKESFLYQKLEKNKVKCLTCAHYCQISEGKKGFCKVRINKKGKLYSLVYNKVAAVNIDPIEKKPLFHFMPGTVTYSIGAMGCNFSCAFCQNYAISQIEKEPEQYGKNISPREIIWHCVKNKIKSISYTYNEPTVFLEYAIDIAKQAKKQGIKNIFVSNGYQSREARKVILPYLDAINIDLKSFDNNFYLKLCKAKLKPVLDNIEWFFKKGVHLEITTLLIPKKNDSKKEITKMAEFISRLSPSLPWHLSRFYPQYLMDKEMITSEKSLLEAYKIGKKAGLKYVYLGNILTNKYENTYCPKCQSLMIKRLGYFIERYDREGKCSQCLTSLDIS